MSAETITLGPKGQGGHNAEVERAFDDDEGGYYHTWLIYELHGVESITADKPEAVGHADHTLVSIEFVNGKSVQIMGSITKVNHE